MKIDGVATHFTTAAAAAESKVAVNLAMGNAGSPEVVQIYIGNVAGVATGASYDCSTAFAGQGVTYTSQSSEIFYANSTTGACGVLFSEIGQAVGARVKGTFSATVKNVAGTSTHELTDGSFDVVLKGSSD